MPIRINASSIPSPIPSSTPSSTSIPTPSLPALSALSTLPVLLLLAIAAALPPPASAQSAAAQPEPFALGADISYIPQREAGNVRYAHNGVVRDIFDILGEHGFNYIRLRLFVDPTAEIAGEKESPYSARGFCGRDSTIKMAKRVRAAGMKFLLDFHYSDTWADPGKQHKPVSWAGLNFAQLTAKVRSYTKETLEVFRDSGVAPDMVQVGNEVVGGMIWPDGRISNMANFAALVNAGIDGVKDVDTSIKIMIHTINERDPNGWLTRLKNAGVTRIDVFGLSYYSEYHGEPDSLDRVVKAVAKSNAGNSMRIAVVEYADNHRAVNDIVFNLPEDKRFGTFVWEPCDWRETLFDWKNGRRESNWRLALYPVMALDFGVWGGGDGDGGDGGDGGDSTTVGVVNRGGSLGRLGDGIADFSINSNGVVTYSSSGAGRGRITVYDLRGRVARRVYVKSAGTYNPVASLRSGAYVVVVAVEALGGGGAKAVKIFKR